MDLDGGTGFDRGFLSEAVNPPVCEPAELLVVDGQVEIRYMHFSLGCMGSGGWRGGWPWNIDRVDSLGRDDISRDGMRFGPDQRVPVDAQTTDAVYVRNRLDRGHLACRTTPDDDAPSSPWGIPHRDQPRWGIT